MWIILTSTIQKKYVSHDYINIDQYVERPKQTKILKNQ